MNNSEKLNILVTTDLDKRNKTLEYVLDTTMCKQTHIMQTTYEPFMQTIGDKDESNIVFKWQSKRL